MVAAKCGSLLGNLCGALMREILTEEQLVDFGWRIPFLSGILIAFVALYLRCHGEEVHTNANVYDHQDSEIKNPIRASFRKGNRMALLSTSLTPMLWSAGSVLSFIWMPIYMSELVEPPVDHAFWINAGAMFSGVIFMLPLAGHISDKVGRTKTMTVAACFLGILGPIMVILIAQSIPVLAFFAQLVLGITLSFFGGPLCAWLVENYSPEVRLTSASLGYDIAHAIAGGVSPAMATALADGVGIYSPGMLYTIFAFVSLIGIITMHCLKGGAGGVDKELDSGVSSTEEASSATNTKPSEMELPEMS
jgi:MHS family proline/betaine transporter-like MFS transporter